MSGVGTGVVGCERLSGGRAVDKGFNRECEMRKRRSEMLVKARMRCIVLVRRKGW